MVSETYKHLSNGVAWFTAIWLAFGLPLSPLQFVEPAKAADGSMVLFWDGSGALPGAPDWTDESNDGSDFMDRYVRAGGTYLASGGATTHTHTPTYVTEGGGATIALGQMGGPPAMDSAGGHSHGLLSAYSVGTGANTPPFRSLRAMSYTATGVPSTIPSGAIAMFESTSDYGSDWTTYTAQDGYFLYADNAAGVTATGGSTTHTHTFATGLFAEGGFPNMSDAGGATSYAMANHGHATGSNTNTSSDSNNPPYVEVVFAKANQDISAANFPAGMLVGFTATQGIAATWDFTVSQSGGTYYQKFLLGDSSTPGGTGGDGTSTHTNTTATSGAPDTTGKDGSIFFASSSTATYTHTHTVTASWSSDANLPIYRELLLAEYKPPDPTWVLGSAQFDIYQSSSTTWDSGTLICSATLTDNNSSTVDCTSGTITASTQYRVQVVLKNVGAGVGHMDYGGGDIIYHKAVKAGWAGTTPTLGTCAFNDLGADNTGITACTAAWASNDVTLLNTGSGSDVVMAASTGTEGFAYLITTDSDATTSSTSYMDVSLDGTTENSSTITISIPSTLGVTGPTDVTLTSANPGTTGETTFADPSELVIVTDGGSGWSLTVDITTTLSDGGTNTIPDASVHIRKDGVVGGGSDNYTIWSGTTTNVSETNAIESLDTPRSVGTRSSGSGETTNVRPTIRVVVPPSQTPADYDGVMRFTVV
jgi:hypothetical protein